MRTRGTAIEDCRGGWLDSNNLHIRIVFLQSPAYTGNRTTGTYAGYKDVNLSVGLFPQFFARGMIVFFWIGGILKLLENDGSWCGIAQGLGSLDGSRHSFCTGGELHLSSVSLH